MVWLTKVVGSTRKNCAPSYRVPEDDPHADDTLSTSHWNQHEIDMAVGLVGHPVRQGRCDSNDIAVTP